MFCTVGNQEAQPSPVLFIPVFVVVRKRRDNDQFNFRKLRLLLQAQQDLPGPLVNSHASSDIEVPDTLPI